jgi:hypothetical protein
LRLFKERCWEDVVVPLICPRSKLSTTDPFKVKAFDVSLSANVIVKQLINLTNSLDRRNCVIFYTTRGRLGNASPVGNNT